MTAGRPKDRLAVEAGPGVPPHIRIQLLGNFELRVDGRLVALAAVSQRVAAYLALRGTTMRCRLAAELWPDATPERAMGCLRTAIWRVNRPANGLVRAAGGALDLDPQACIDVRQGLLAPGALLTATSSPDPGAMPPGVELLPTWEDEWLLHDRERVRQLQLHVLEAGAERLTEAGAFGVALEWALAALRADPLRESAHRAVIRVHVAEGNLVEARRAYNACADLFLRELGVRPSARAGQLLVAASRDSEVTAR